MGGGQQTNPAEQNWQQYQQQQTYKDLGNSLSQGFQRAGASVAGANSGLSGQVAQAPSAGQQQEQHVGANFGASGPLFTQQQAGGGAIDEQQLAQILRSLGYGG
jgi:hypothetical protein